MRGKKKKGGKHPSTHKGKKHSGKSNFKRDLRKEIFHILEQIPGKAINYKQISSTLGVNDSGVRRLIQEILRDEAAKGRLKEVERGKYVAAKINYETVEGRIEITRHGKGYLIVD